jgi:dipeptidyl aminopeptidase/acylaminoacyl peptidase
MMLFPARNQRWSCGNLRNPKRASRTGVHSGCACLLIVICGFCGLQARNVHENQATRELLRPVTVSDAVEMTRLGDPDYVDGAPSFGRVAQFSRDGKQFVVVVRKGNLEQNTNEYELLLWKTDKLGDPGFPKRLLRMSSSSNRCAIESVNWLVDDERLVFLGEQPGGLHQLYTFNTESRVLTKLTNHSTNIVSYGITPDGRRIAFLAEAPDEPLFDLQAKRQGVLVTTQPLPDLLLGRTSTTAVQLWFQDESGHSREFAVRESTSYSNSPVLSSDGRFIVVRAEVASIPEDWKRYPDPLLQGYTTPITSQGQGTWLSRYAVIDTQTGQSRFLLNSPVRSVDSLIAWSPDDKSVAIAGVYLPLDDAHGEELRTKLTKTFAVEVNVSDGTVTRIAREDQITPSFTHDYKRSLTWDRQPECLLFGFSSVYPAPDLKPQVGFAKQAGRWGIVQCSATKPGGVDVVLEENMNTAPRVFAVDTITHRKTMLLDLNPQFAFLQFGKVEEIEWKGSDGRDVKGGLYYPVDYEPGKRYPLVIQTHLWTRDRFWIDGPWTTAFAAQPLAGKGIMVLQADESEDDFGKFQEIHREAASFEGAIDYLNRKGLIDAHRVGIIGFSRTCLFVQQALTHSNHRFAAAAIADGIDDGYFQYLMFANSSPVLLEYSEWANGGQPFGKGLESWNKRASGFNVERVSTPVRIMARNPESLLLEWEWFAGLTVLKKPVEMVYLQNGAHMLQKPWDRMVSQQGNVDWFAFWLKGEEDPDASKSEQYARWRRLRLTLFGSVLGGGSARQTTPN